MIHNHGDGSSVEINRRPVSIFAFLCLINLTKHTIIFIVDNAGSGGNVDAAVDVETGRIYNVVEFNGWRKAREIKCHPDSGTKMEGVIIENWQAIKDEVQRFQQCFPYCKAAGWDIAITDDGPVVVEVNDFWDRTGQYFIKKGWKKEIRDCYLAWKKTGKKYTLFRQPNELDSDHLIRISAHE